MDELIRTLLQAPLYKKPEIGANPFKPLAGSKPDRTADGVKKVMTVIAAAFEKEQSEKLTIGKIMHFTHMHRLKLERYLKQACTENLLSKDLIERYSVTDNGFDYLVNHGVIDA